MDGHKHIIECHCILPQYKNRPNPPWHKFIVFSIIDDSNTIVPKYTQCNNCGTVHKIIDLCKSEIVPGRDELKSITNIDDIKIMIPRDIREILENYKADLATWEHTHFFLQQQKWGESIILTKDTIKDEVHGKIMILDGPEKTRIESFSYNTFIEKGIT